MSLEAATFQRLTECYVREFVIEVDGVQYRMFTKKVTAEDALPYILAPAGEERRRAMSKLIARSLVKEDGTSFFDTGDTVLSEAQRIKMLDQLPSPIYFLISGHYMQIIGTTNVTEKKSDKEDNKAAEETPEPVRTTETVQTETGAGSVAEENPSLTAQL